AERFALFVLRPDLGLAAAQVPAVGLAELDGLPRRDRDRLGSGIPLDLARRVIVQRRGAHQDRAVGGVAHLHGTLVERERALAGKEVVKVVLQAVAVVAVGAVGVALVHELHALAQVPRPDPPRLRFGPDAHAAAGQRVAGLVAVQGDRLLWG